MMITAAAVGFAGEIVRSPALRRPLAANSPRVHHSRLCVSPDEAAMKLHRALIFTAALLPLTTHAIEPSATVKVTQLLKTTQTWNGAPIKYPNGQAEVTSLMIEIAPGGETQWHEHPVPSFGVLLEGTLEVSLADGKKKLLKAGEAIAEVIATAHNGRNVGTTPVKLVVFYAGAVGKQLSLQRPDAKP
jgi:quercetin dioxygenase-like cupin family protein